jgi:hypothetical protein
MQTSRLVNGTKVVGAAETGASDMINALRDEKQRCMEPASLSYARIKPKAGNTGSCRTLWPDTRFLTFKEFTLSHQDFTVLPAQYQGIDLLSGKLRIFADSPWCNRQPLVIFSDDCFNSDIYQHHPGTNSAADGIISPGRLDQSHRGRKFTKHN